jgi:hypothetical protein
LQGFQEGTTVESDIRGRGRGGGREREKREEKRKEKKGKETKKEQRRERKKKSTNFQVGSINGINPTDRVLGKKKTRVREGRKEEIGKNSTYSEPITTNESSTRVSNDSTCEIKRNVFNTSEFQTTSSSLVIESEETTKCCWIGTKIGSLNGEVGGEDLGHCWRAITRMHAKGKGTEC